MNNLDDDDVDWLTTEVGISPWDASDLGRLGRVKEYSIGEIVWRESVEVPRKTLCLVREGGFVRIETAGRKGGKPALVDIVLTGQWFGHSALRSIAMPSRHSATARVEGGPVTLLRFDGADVFRLMGQSPELREFLLQDMARIIRKLDLTASGLRQNWPPERRVARQLQWLTRERPTARPNGGEREAKRKYTSVPLTQQDLADLVGLKHRDTIGTAFKTINTRAEATIVDTDPGVGAFGVDVRALGAFIDKEWPHTEGAG